MQSASSSPFVDVIQLLAGFHQEHHQTLMECRVHNLIQAQQEDCKLFRSWMDQ